MAASLCLGCMEPETGVPVCPRCGWDRIGSAESVLHLPPGTLLNGSYLVGRVLGQGGFGITYMGWDTQLHRKIAIKEYFPQVIASRLPSSCTVTATGPQARADFDHGLQSFMAEGRILARFNDHPCIVSVLNLFEVNHTGYLVMGYLEGMTLARSLEASGGRIPYDSAREIMMRVMDGLREVHKQGLLHRDISPDNIYLTRQGPVKILDFGAARFEAGEKSRSLSVVLKEGYAPEEQYRRNGHQGPWTDVYAVAATLYRSITGVVPPPSLERLHSDTLRKASELGAVISPKAEAVLLRGLALRAGDRYQSVEDFQEALQGAIAAAPSKEFAQNLVPKTEPLSNEPAKPQPPRSEAPPQPPRREPPPAAARPRPSLSGRGKWIGVSAVLLVLFAGALVRYKMEVDRVNAARLAAEKQAIAAAEQQKKDAAAAAEADRQRKAAAAVAHTGKTAHGSAPKLPDAAEAERQRQETERLQQEAAAAEAERLRREAAEAAKQREQQKAVVSAKELSQQYEIWLAKRSKEMAPSVITVTLKNACNSGPMWIAMRFKVPDDTGRWMTSGWWKVDPGKTVQPKMATAGHTVYFWAKDALGTWDGAKEAGSVTVPVVSNDFVHLDGAEIQGRDKQNVIMFANTFKNWGDHTVGFTCNNRR